MTKDRFDIVKSKLIKDGWVISDKLKQFTFPTLKGDKRALFSYCKALNELHEENEQLKQFKEDVFNKIDMHLRMLPTTRDNELNEDDGDPSLYTGAIYMLETLKKELKE